MKSISALKMAIMSIVMPECYQRDFYDAQYDFLNSDDEFPYVEGERQSPIDIDTSNIDSRFIIDNDPTFYLRCGSISFESMRVINNKSLEFDLEDSWKVYQSSLSDIFYRE